MPTRTTKMEKRSVDFSKPQFDNLERNSDALGISFSELVRRIIDQDGMKVVLQAFDEHRKDEFIDKVFEHVPVLVATAPGDPARERAEAWWRVGGRRDLLPKPQSRRKTPDPR